MVLGLVPDALESRKLSSNLFVKSSQPFCEHFVAVVVERVAGFEPVTACLGSKNSTAELHPLQSLILSRKGGIVKAADGYWRLSTPAENGTG